MSKNLLSGLALAVWILIVATVTLGGDPPDAGRAREADGPAPLWAVGQPDALR